MRDESGRFYLVFVYSLTKWLNNYSFLLGY